MNDLSHQTLFLFKRPPLAGKILLLLLFLLGTAASVTATKYSSSSASHNISLGVTPGDTDQEIMMVTVVGTNGGGGGWNIDQITFTTQNTTNTDVDAAYCYYSTDATLDIGSDALKGTIANPAGNMVFTINETGLGSATYYLFLVYDINPLATACSGVVDAYVATNGLVTSGNSGGNHTPTTNNPTGDRGIEGTGCWTYCTVNGTSNAFGHITNVTFNTINRTSGYDGYVDTGNSTTIEQGVNIDLSVSMSNSSTTGRYTAAWIDFNNDGDFLDADEQIMSAEINYLSGAQTRTVTSAIPLSAVIGATKMRVVWKYAPSQSEPEPCDAYSDQVDWEDYDITIAAATAMAYSSCTTTQSDLTNIKAGLTKKMVLGIEIVTTGASPTIDVSSFSFSTNGSTAPGTDIVNARIYSTGTSNSFITGTQIGSTYTGPSGAFVMNLASPHALANGTNYFWLTYDIESTAGCANVVDAECTSLTVDGVARTPTVTAPAGTRALDCITPYYSQGNLDASLLASWNSARDGSGSAPGSFGATDGFFVQPGHSMTTSAATTIPYLNLESGSIFTATFLITCTDLMLQAGCTFDQRVAAANGTYVTNFYIFDEATWIHNNAGWLPAVNRYFDPNSNQVFYQWGGGTFPSNTIWGNVKLEGTTTGDFGMGNVMTNIQGNFEWARTGDVGVNYLYDQIDETIEVGGNLIISGGWFKVCADNTTPFVSTSNVTINVEGDLIVTSGTIEDYMSGTGDSGAEINVGRDVEISGGTLDLSGSPNRITQLNLTGGTASVTWEQTGGAVDLCNTNIASGKTVTLIGSNMGNFPVNQTLTVNGGGTLDMATYAVEGAGNVTVETGASLGMGATNASGALTSTASAGNIQVTGTRSYHSGGNYRYYGTANQSTGDQLPASISGSLITDNSTAAGTVTLTQSTAVSGALTLTQGDLISTSTERLTINAAATIAPVRGSATSFVSGWVDREVNAATAFEVPIGSSSDDRWRPMSITPTDATTRTWTVEFVDDDPETLGSTYSGTDSVNAMNDFYYYNTSRSPATGSADIKVWYDDADLGTLNESTLVIGHWSGAEWNCWDKDDMATEWSRDASNNWVEVKAAGTFSPIGVGGDDTPLPIELLDFSARQFDGQVALEWTTATELNNDHFVVERSRDGIHFEPLIRVEGAGTSFQTQEYFSADAAPYYGVSFYRLKQTDFDGSFVYTKMVAVEMLEKYVSALRTFPNPAHSQVSVAFTSATAGTAAIQLLSSVGQLLQSKNISTTPGENTIPLELGSYSRGIYFIAVSTNTGVYKQKIQLQ